MDIWEVFTGTKRRMIGPSLAMFANLILESVGIFVQRSPTTFARTCKFLKILNFFIAHKFQIVTFLSELKNNFIFN